MLRLIYLLFLTHYFTYYLYSQEIKQFRLEDFELIGHVKECQVITDYGQEIFEFDNSGRLIKVATQYNEGDKDVTSYKFENSELVEKRVEHYNNNRIDLSASIAHFYDINTKGNKRIKEQIVSYDKQFVEVQEYLFDQYGQLKKIMVSHEDAIDEIVVKDSIYRDEHTKTYFQNNVIQKSIRKSFKKYKKQPKVEVILTKTFLSGEPNKAVEEIRDHNGLLLEKTIFEYDLEKKEFVLVQKHSFNYDMGILDKEIIEKDNNKTIREYIYQFDANEQKNWVRKVITPENIFTRRKITYYPKEVAAINK